MNLRSMANPLGEEMSNKIDLVLPEETQSGPGNVTNNYQ